MAARSCRSPRLQAQAAVITTAGPPESEQDYLLAISSMNSIAGGESWTGACDGGLDRRALEVTYPASTGAAKSRTQATARERTQAGVLGSAYPSQVRAARGRSPASREGADQQPSFGGVSGSAGAGGKRAPGVLFQAQPLHGRSSLGSGAPVVAAAAAWNATAASKTHASQHAASGSEPPVRSGGSRAPGR